MFLGHRANPSQKTFRIGRQHPSLNHKKSKNWELNKIFQLEDFGDGAKTLNMLYTNSPPSVCKRNGDKSSFCLCAVFDRVTLVVDELHVGIFTLRWIFVSFLCAY